MTSEYSFRGLPFYGNEEELKKLQAESNSQKVIGLTLHSFISLSLKGRKIKFSGTLAEKYPEPMQIFDAALSTKAEYYGERTVIIDLTFKKSDIRLSEKYYKEAEWLSARGGDFVYIEVDADEVFEFVDDPTSQKEEK